MIDPSGIPNLYASGLSATQIGKRLGIAHTSVLYWLKKKGVKRRSKSDALKAVIANGGMRMPRPKGSNHYNWKNGRIERWDGYVLRLLPNHPRADSNGYVREHILVAEKMLGAPLPEGYVVHHINHKRNDNRRANLRIMSAFDHTSYHSSLPRKKA